VRQPSDAAARWIGFAVTSFRITE